MTKNKKVLLLGIGNELIGDDRVGIEVVRFIEVFRMSSFDIKYSGISGFRLLDYISGYTHVIIVDACEKDYTDIDDYKVLVYDKEAIIDNSLLWSSHEESLGLGLKLAINSFPEHVPEYVKFVAIEIPVQKNYSEVMTKKTSDLAKIAIDKVFDLLEEIGVCQKPYINMEFLRFDDFNIN